MCTLLKNTITKAERKKYSLIEKRDFEILTKVKQLERLPLQNEDRVLVKLIRTQLEQDWRKPLLKKLNSLMTKYNG